MADPGIDYSAYPALDLTFEERTGVAVLVEDALRAGTIPAGAMWWAPQASLDLREMVNASLDTGAQRQLTQQLTGMFAEDERAAVTASVQFSGGQLTASYEITPVEGETFTAEVQIAADGLITLNVTGVPS